MAHGLVRANPESFDKTVAIIGDSTFLHSGLTGLLDVVYNQAPVTVLILDNSTTAMTGHQDNPATGLSLQNKEAPQVDLVEICRSLGVKRVQTVDAFDLKDLEAKLKTELSAKEPSVLIVRRPCIFLLTEFDDPYFVDSEACTGCKACMKLGCPAIGFKEGKAVINPLVCNACGLCPQVCRFEAIKPAEEKGGA